MSALAGIVRFDGGPADVATVARMIDCVEHRGRDWRDVRRGAVTLAYRWRRTGRRRRPTRSRVRSIGARVLVFDGRLDNRPDLATDLESATTIRCRTPRWCWPRIAGGGRHAPAAARRFRARALGRPRTSPHARARPARRPDHRLRGSRWLLAFATEPRQLLLATGVDSRPIWILCRTPDGIVSHRSDTIFRGVSACRPPIW